MKASHELEHFVWKSLKEYCLTDKKFLLAVSGGADSMALLAIFTRILNKKNIFVAHYHHGVVDSDKLQSSYRNEAQKLVEEFCLHENLKLFLDKNINSQLESEEEFRKLRYCFFKNCLDKNQIDVLVTAHHQDDQWETQMIRLLRGTGSIGFLGMKVLEDKLYKPFLSIKPSALREYLKSRHIKWIEDPTNLTNDALRNWIRNDLKNMLNHRDPSMVVNMTQSFTRISDAIENIKPALTTIWIKNDDGSSLQFSKLEYLTLNKVEQKRGIAQVLYQILKSGYSAGHVEEIWKNLDKQQNEHTFAIASSQWIINAERVLVQTCNK